MRPDSVHRRRHRGPAQRTAEQRGTLFVVGRLPTIFRNGPLIQERCRGRLAGIMSTRQSGVCLPIFMERRLPGGILHPLDRACKGPYPSILRVARHTAAIQKLRPPSVKSRADYSR